MLALIGAASYLLGWSSLLSVKSVSLSFTGIKDPNFNSNDFINQYLDQHHEVVKLGSPVARLKVNEITHQIEQLPWVHDSFISRGWFSGKVTIYVHEREPVASMSVSAPNTYIDKG